MKIKLSQGVGGMVYAAFLPSEISPHRAGCRIMALIRYLFASVLPEESENEALLERRFCRIMQECGVIISGIDFSYSFCHYRGVIGNFASTKNGKIEKPANGKIQSPVHACLDIKKAFVILGLQTKTDKRQWKSMTNYQNSPCGAKLRNLFQMA